MFVWEKKMSNYVRAAQEYRSAKKQSSTSCLFEDQETSEGSEQFQIDFKGVWVTPLII